MFLEICCLQFYNPDFINNVLCFEDEKVNAGIQAKSSCANVNLTIPSIWCSMLTIVNTLS